MTDDQSAASVFGLLADETRVAVLRAVATAQEGLDGTSSPRTALSFTEVYEAVDVDNTSKLSYHLGELEGTLLRKDDRGYALTHAGERIARFVLSRNYERPAEFGPTPTDGTCLFCSASPLEAGLEHTFLFVRCPACDRGLAGIPVTPAQVRSWGDGDLIRNVKQKQALDYRQIRRGTCPECAGRLSTTVREVPVDPLPDDPLFVAVARCEACLRRYNGPLTHSVTYHPASVALHWDHGIDVMTKGIWEFHHHVREGRWTAERVSTDPEAYEVVLRRGDDVLRFHLDERAAVTRTERVRRRGGADDEN